MLHFFLDRKKEGNIALGWFHLAKAPPKKGVFSPFHAVMLVVHIHLITWVFESLRCLSSLAMAIVTEALLPKTRY
jgi:hypothetical protein